MTTKNCANGPKLVLKDLCEKSFVRNVWLPLFDYEFQTLDPASPNASFRLLQVICSHDFPRYYAC